MQAISSCRTAPAKTRFTQTEPVLSQEHSGLKRPLELAASCKNAELHEHQDDIDEPLDIALLRGARRMYGGRTRLLKR